MIITYQGDNYFKIQSGNLVVLIDPTNGRSFRGATAVVNTTLPPSTEAPKENECFWIEHQGEYEVQGIRIDGWSAGNEDETEKTIYRILFEDISIVVLGHLSKEPAQNIWEHIEHPDILIVPAGGKPWISQGAAAKFVRQAEPSVIIPSLTSDPKLFFKELNKPTPQKEEKFVFKKKDLVPGAMTIKYLESK